MVYPKALRQFIGLPRNNKGRQWHSLPMDYPSLDLRGDLDPGQEIYYDWVPGVMA